MVGQSDRGLAAAVELQRLVAPHLRSLPGQDVPRQVDARLVPGIEYQVAVDLVQRQRGGIGTVGP